MAVPDTPTLLVICSGDLDDVSSELWADRIDSDSLRHSLLHEYSDCTLIININQRLLSCCRVGEIELR
jgi:hypothetical protein